MRRHIIGLLVGSAALVTRPAPAAEPLELRRYAIVVGANDGGPDRLSLRYATTDADQMSRLLTELGGVAPTDQIVLHDPSRADLEAELQRLGQRIQANEQASRRTEVVVYYSGHSDERGLLLGQERLSYAELRADIDELDADVRIAVLDSCASGALVMGKGGQHIAAFLVDESTNVEGHAFLMSSSADEASQETDRLGGSYFTHALVTGLRGGADINLDGQVTLNEAYRFAYDETLARTETTLRGAQHPHYDMALTGTGDLVMTDLRSTSASMEIAQELEGRMYIRDEERRLVAEMYKPAGRAVALGLPPGWYRVTLDRGGALSQAEITLSEGTSEPLDASAFTDFEGEVAVARGGPSEEPGWRHVPVTLAILPDIAFGAGADVLVAHNLAIGLVAAGGDKLDGAAISTGANFYEQDAKGVMVAAGTNIVGGSFGGMQASAGANIAGGAAWGLQATAGGNIVGGSFGGMQASAGGNIVGESFGGMQASAGANVVRGAAWGVQATGGGNIVGGSFGGVQASAGVNIVGDDMEGVQVAPVNVAAREARGAQVGVVNVGGVVHGVQIGVINIADDLQGVPIGVISFSRTGILAGEVFTSDLATANVAIKMGSRRVYNTYFVGWSALGGSSVNSQGPSGALLYGGGLGVRVMLDPLQIDTDLLYTSAYPRPYSVVDSAQILQWRMTAGLPVAKHFTPYAGLTFGLLLPHSNNVDYTGVIGPQAFTASGWTFRYWPGFVAGIRI